MLQRPAQRAVGRQLWQFKRIDFLNLRHTVDPRADLDPRNRSVRRCFTLREYLDVREISPASRVCLLSIQTFSSAFASATPAAGRPYSLAVTRASATR